MANIYNFLYKHGNMEMESYKRSHFDFSVTC